MKRKRNFCSSSSGTRGDQQGAAFRIVSALGLLLGENGRRVAAYDHVARCLPYHQLPDVGLPQSGSFCHPAGVSLTQHHRRTGTPLLLYPKLPFDRSVRSDERMVRIQGHPSARFLFVFLFLAVTYKLVPLIERARRSSSLPLLFYFEN